MNLNLLQLKHVATNNVLAVYISNAWSTSILGQHFEFWMDAINEEMVWIIGCITLHHD